jgi:hypothetical protein
MVPVNEPQHYNSFTGSFLLLIPPASSAKRGASRYQQTLHLEGYCAGFPDGDPCHADPADRPGCAVGGRAASLFCLRTSLIVQEIQLLAQAAIFPAHYCVAWALDLDSSAASLVAA